MEHSNPPAQVGSNAGLGVTVTARALEWDQDSGYQWTDRNYGFSIMEEPDDNLPFSAAWGEGDAEQFATLNEAQAWCQEQIDAWIGRYAVVQRESWTDAQIDAICAPNRAQRWRNDGRQYDRDTARLIERALTPNVPMSRDQQP